MRTASKLKYGLGTIAALALVALVILRAWVVPEVLRGQLQARFEGHVHFRDWWIDGRSAGVTGLTLHEGARSDSPIFASADRVATDLSLASVLRGRLTPRRVTLDAPKVLLRLDKRGRFENLPALRGGGGSPARLPTIEARGAEVTFRPAGRPEMVVKGIDGRLASGAAGSTLSAGTDDPYWGKWEASGTIGPSFRSGSVALEGKRVAADRERLARVPFVPSEVWSHFVPNGPVGVRVQVVWEPGKPSIDTRTEVTLLGTRASFPSLSLDTSRATGTLIVENGVVRAEQFRGEAIGGAVTAGGTLDFAKAPPRIDLGLGLHKINVADAPKSWQLDEAGITGLLTGKVDLHAVLDPKGVDLSGSSGEAVVEGGTIQGIPVKSLKLVMRARGDDLQFATKSPGSASFRGRFGPLILVAIQAGEKEKDEPRAGGIQLPRSVTTQIELDDVDMALLIAKAQTLTGLPFPVPITGKLSVKAEATIPLGKLRSLKDYAFHGDLTMKGASLYKVDIGRVSARIDLADGVLELKDFRGRLVDHPNGGPDNPPEALPAIVPAEGPIPPGGFRGLLRAELSPPGRLSARFEGNDLPLGELAAPALPRPTPLSGLASLNINAEVDLSRASDPEAWTVAGDLRSRHITYQKAVLDGLALAFSLKQGTLDVPALSAQLDGQPLKSRLNLGLKPPRAFHGTLDVTDWDLAALLALIPGAPRPAPVTGTFSARAEASGTVNPRTILTNGQGRFKRLAAGPVTLGDVPFRWTTDRDVIVLSGIEAHPFGGTLKVEARVPVTPGQPTEGSASIAGLDTARLSAAIPGEGLKLTGKADGQVQFRLPPDRSAVEATVRLNAPDLTVQGIPAEKVHASVRAHAKALTYEVTADSLGGKVKFKGDFPLSLHAAPAHGIATPVNGEIQAVGFTLARAWRALGMKGAVASLEGLGAIDANVRSLPSGTDAGLWAHGIAEFRDLSWGIDYPLGQLRGIVVKTPASWRVEPLTGEILGGPVHGFLWGTTPARGGRKLGFDLRIDQADLRRVLALLPMLARNAEGSGTLRMAGGLDESFRATAEMDVAQARLLGLPLHQLRAPAELVLAPVTGAGVLRLRHWSARFAGGQVRGDATLRLGADRSFQSEIQLTQVDLETLARIESDTRRPASGRISGKIQLHGADPARVEGYKGRMVLDLDDASLVSLPVFRALDRFLGAAGGGLFEDGDLVATIANKRLIIEMFTLQGRIAQLHATGTVGFDGQVNLEVLINTNQIIPQTGQALVGAVPGLRDAMGRSREATLQVANFLSNRLLKVRITGTVKNPSVALDPAVAVGETAVGFFAGVLKLPLGLVK